MEDQPPGALKDNLYLSRYAYTGKLICESPLPQLNLVVTIPCCNEPDLISSLEALHQCEIGQLHIEVIVVINEGINAAAAVSQQNTATFDEATRWAEKNSDHQRKFHIIYKNDLPPKHAGVGLARKIAMDEAVRRFDAIGKPEGVIVCFDADSSCDLNYLQVIHDFFLKHHKAPGCSIYFEHPLGGDHESEVYEAIVDYELFLRYYVNALRFAKYPYAYETIGSSMAVRSAAYQKQGGMNRRKAGEDFYFLHRIIPLGNFGEINNTRVIPSPRRSDRVPFGTGKAVNDWLENKELLTYSPATFRDLKDFIDRVDKLYNIDPPGLEEFIKALPECVSAFLALNAFGQEVARINRHAASPETFIKQFYYWFDGFKVLKYVHYARDNFYPNMAVKDAAGELLRMVNRDSSDLDSRGLLEVYRMGDRVPL